MNVTGFSAVCVCVCVADLRNVCAVIEIHCLEDVVLVQSIVVAGAQELPNVLHLNRRYSYT